MWRLGSDPYCLQKEKKCKRSDHVLNLDEISSQGLEGFRDNFEAQTTTDRDAKGKGHHEDTLTFQNKFSSDIKFFSEAAVQKCSYE